MKTAFPALVLSLFLSVAAAQSYRRVFTLELLQKQLQSDPVLVETRREIEHEALNFEQGPPLDSIAAVFKDSLLPLPVVFHVLYKSAAEYVTPQQVLSQITALNRDFGPAELLFNPFSPYSEVVSGGAMLQFCLPAEGGIYYYPVGQSDWSADSLHAALGAGTAPPWEPEHYINIWVANLADDAAGYAQMPGGPPETDGIVIDYEMFGTTGTAKAPYNEGKTLTHLMGNYFNLFSLWGETPCSDDYVWDTPVHNAPNFEYWEQGHVSACPDRQAEMLENFMDCTPDSIRSVFTRGQVQRIYACLTGKGPRARLAKSTSSCAQNPQFASPQVRDSTGSALSHQAGSGISVFPNPTDGIIHISTDRPDLQLHIFHSNGTLLQTLDHIPGHCTVSGGNWPNGLYFLVFQSNGRFFALKSVSIQRP